MDFDYDIEHICMADILFELRLFLHVIYAVDIVLFANTAKDLQQMLNLLHNWCSRWGLKVNSRKTKIVHYRPSSQKRSCFAFKCGDQQLEITDKYRYLGLWFTEDLDFDFMVKQVAAAAQRSLGLLIAKAKAIGGFTHEQFTQLYSSLVQSVIDYGVCVWGHSEFSCINAVQNRAMRFFLGVNSKAPNTAVVGEMGWIPSCVHQWSCIARYFCHFSQICQFE